ncbi:unnamed protein product [Somion occarium]|uniref:Uncharacterized protein n=1 Tax=Somion occarium TaxID=3059160 RepID=A0ABP1CRC3_9APHY
MTTFAFATSIQQQSLKNESVAIFRSILIQEVNDLPSPSQDIFSALKAAVDVEELVTACISTVSLQTRSDIATHINALVCLGRQFSPCSSDCPGLRDSILSVGTHLSTRLGLVHEGLCCPADRYCGYMKVSCRHFEADSDASFTHYYGLTPEILTANPVPDASRSREAEPGTLQTSVPGYNGKINQQYGY